MRTLIVILVIVVVLVAITWFAKSSSDKIDFKFDFAGISFKDVSITNPIANVKVKTTIQNKNNFNIVFSNLYAEFFYNNKLFASSNGIDTRKHVVPKNGILEFISDINLFINSNTIALINKIASKQDARIDFAISLKLFGIKLPIYKSHFNIP